MLKIVMPNENVLKKNYRKEFKYGAINIENKEIEITKKLEIGKREEVEITFAFDNNSKLTTKGKIAFVDLSGFVFAFDNNDHSLILKQKIEKIIGNNKINTIF